MSLIPRISSRPEAILRIPDAIARGLNVTAFIKELTRLGLSYSNTLMLADWRTVAQIEAKKDVIKHTRKDRYPAITRYAEVDWRFSKEYIYKLKCRSRLRVGEPIVETFATIESDIPLTPRMMAEKMKARWPEIYGITELLAQEELVEAIPVAGYRRVPSPETE